MTIWAETSKIINIKQIFIYLNNFYFRFRVSQLDFIFSNLAL